MDASKLQSVLSKERSFQVSFRAVDAAMPDKVTVEGIASTSEVDSYDTVIEPAAYADSMRAYIDKNPIVLLQHKPEKPIGQVTEYSIKPEGLFVRADITENVDGVFSAIQNRVLRGFSIGFNPVSYEFRIVGDREIVAFTRIDIKEISVVSIPANPNSYFSLSRSMKLISEEVRKARSEDTQGEAAPVAAAPEAQPIATEPVQQAENAGETPVPVAPAAPDALQQAQAEGVKPSESAPVAAAQAPEETPAPTEAPIAQPTEAELAAKKAATEAEEKAKATEAALAEANQQLEAAKAKATEAEAKLAAVEISLADARKSKEETEQRMAKQLSRGTSNGRPVNETKRTYLSLVEIARHVNI